MQNSPNMKNFQIGFKKKKLVSRLVFKKQISANTNAKSDQKVKKKIYLNFRKKILFPTCQLIFLKNFCQKID